MEEAGVWVDRMDSLVTIYESEPHAIEKELKSLRALVTLHRAEVCQMHGKRADAARYYADYSRSDYGQTLEGRIDGCEHRGHSGRIFTPNAHRRIVYLVN